MARDSAGPSIVLVGRPNVGKSTLFNRITGSRRSIVAPVAGTTRDMLTAASTWKDRTFTLIDTGGLFGATTDPLHSLVVERGLGALKRADVVVFVVDGQEGLVPGDERIAQEVRATGRPVVLAINKTDDKRARAAALEFERMGFKDVYQVSAEHGTGVYELLDAAVSRLPKSRKPAPALVAAPSNPKASEKAAEEDAEEAAARAEAKADPNREIAVALVGRPNVGKSSTVNRLVREERVMVHEQPGTTRDTVDVLLTWHGRQLRLVDTAGMRKPGRIAKSGQVEMVSVVLAKRAMGRADVAVLVIDATEGAGDREAAIAGEAEAAGCGVVIAVNKWDLVRGQGQDWVEAFDDKLRFQLKFLEFAPIVHMSAKTGERTPKLVETIVRVADARQHRVPTASLNKFIEVVTDAHPPVSKNRREVRIMYAAQTAVAPPSFVLFTNVATELHFSYERFLVNRLRESFGFEGTPIRLKVRKRAR